MKISYNWILDYLTASITPNEMENMLIDIGIEVNNTTKIPNIQSNDINHIFIGEIKKILKIDKNFYGILLFNYNNNIFFSSSINNIKKKDYIIFADNNSNIFNKNKFINNYKNIKKFSGIICSESDLNISDFEYPIIISNNKCNLKVNDILNKEIDFIFDINILPDKSYLLSHYYIAQELYFLMKIRKRNVKFNYIKIINDNIINKNSKINDNIININLKNTYYRYIIANISNLNKKFNTPLWMYNKLRNINVNRYNNINDIKNFILYELGILINIFNLKYYNNYKFFLIKKKKKYRNCYINKIHLLDKNKKIIYTIGEKLPNNKKLYYNNIILDSISLKNNFFIKNHIKYNVNYYYYNYYKNYINYNILYIAICRIINIIYSLYKCKLIYLYDKLNKLSLFNNIIVVKYNLLYKILGKKINKKLIYYIFNICNFNIKMNINSFKITVPIYRHDLIKDVDIISEFIKLYNYLNLYKYNNIYIKRNNNIIKNNKIIIKHNINNLLINNKFYEIKTTSFDNKYYNKILNKYNLNLNDKVLLNNIKNNNLNTLRNNMLSNMIYIYTYNNNICIKDINLFEWGKIFFLIKNKIFEENHLGILSSVNGKCNINEYYNKFIYFKGIIEKIIYIVTGNKNYKQNNIKYDKSFFINDNNLFINKIKISSLGYIKHEILEKLNIKNNILFSYIKFNNLLLIDNKKTYLNINNNIYKRDISFLNKEKIKFSDIKNIIMNSNSKIKNVKLYDKYILFIKNNKVISNTIRLYISSDKFKNNEVNNILNNIILLLKKKLKIELRIK